MRVQGYLEIDYQEMDDETFETFNSTLKQFMVHYKKVHKDNREYYHCILKDIDVIDTLLTLLSDRNPVINGLWNQDGTVYDGTTYPFDLTLHLSHQPDVIAYDEETGIESTTTPTEFNAMHQFNGWIACDAY